MNRWFEITVKAEIDNIENGKKKKVTEKYLVDALSYTEAESRSLEIFKDLYNSFEVVSKTVAEMRVSSNLICDTSPKGYN